MKAPVLRRPVIGLLAAAWAVAILVALSRAPILWNTRIRPLLGENPLGVFAGAGVVAVLLLGIWAMRSKRNRRSAFGILILTLGLYAALLFGYYRGEKPAKRFHVVEYGVLAILTLEAVDWRRPRRRGVIVASSFLLLIGAVDESLQAILPLRTFRWLDMAGNWLGAAVGALGWWGASPNSPFRSFDVNDEPSVPRLGGGSE